VCNFAYIDYAWGTADLIPPSPSTVYTLFNYALRFHDWCPIIAPTNAYKITIPQLRVQNALRSWPTKHIFTWPLVLHCLTKHLHFTLPHPTLPSHESGMALKCTKSIYLWRKYSIYIHPTNTFAHWQTYAILYDQRHGHTPHTHTHT